MNDPQAERELKEELSRLSSQAEALIDTTRRGAASLTAIVTSIQLYHAATAVLNSELEGFSKHEDEREKLKEFLMEMTTSSGTTAFELESLLSGLQTASNFIQAELNEDYTEYQEVKSYQPPVVVPIPGRGGPDIRSIERGHGLVVVGGAAGMSRFMDGIEVLIRSHSDSRIIHLSADPSTPQRLTPPDKPLSLLRYPPISWSGTANTKASCHRKIESITQRLSGKSVDIIMVDLADIAHTKPVMMAHEQIIRSLTAIKFLTSVAVHQSAVLIVGLPLEQHPVPEEHSQQLKLIDDQLSDYTLIFKDQPDA